MGIKLISAVAASTVLIGSATAFASPHWMEMNPFPSAPHMSYPGAEPCRPPIDEATREKIDELIEQEMEMMEPVVKRLQQARKKLHKAAMQKPFNETAVKTAAMETAAVEAEFMVSRLKMQARIMEISERRSLKKQ